MDLMLVFIQLVTLRNLLLLIVLRLNIGILIGKRLHRITELVGIENAQQLCLECLLQVVMDLL